MGSGNEDDWRRARGETRNSEEACTYYYVLLVEEAGQDEDEDEDEGKGKDQKELGLWRKRSVMGNGQYCVGRYYYYRQLRMGNGRYLLYCTY